MSGPGQKVYLGIGLTADLDLMYVGWFWVWGFGFNAFLRFAGFRIRKLGCCSIGLRYRDSEELGCYIMVSVITYYSYRLVLSSLLFLISFARIGRPLGDPCLI
jgi:hypothetical protein